MNSAKHPRGKEYTLNIITIIVQGKGRLVGVLGYLFIS